MPEATTLYSVTGAVIVGLVAWVAMVLKQAKEPWARPAPPEEPAEDLEGPESKADEATAKDTDGPDAAAETNSDGAKLDADDTARATPVALSEGRTKAAEEKKEEPKAGEAEHQEAAATEEAEKKEEASS